MNGLVVELAGLPGAGKSALAEALVTQLRADGIPCGIVDAGVSARVPRRIRMIRRTGLALRGVVAAPGAAWRTAGTLGRSRQESPRDTAAVLVQWLATTGLVRGSRAEPGVVLLEEGLVQTAWTALLRARRLDPHAVWSCVPAAGVHSDAVVFLDVPTELAEERLAGRPSRHSRLQHRPAPELSAELRRGQALFEELLGGCPLQVVRISSAGETVEELAQRVSGALRLLV